MNIVWSELALDDLESLRVFIAKDSPKAARRMPLTVIAAIETLPDAPHIGRPGRIPGTRELVVPNTPFIVPYRVHANAVQILRIFHGARRWPGSL